MHKLSGAFITLLLSIGFAAGDTKEEPVGLILSSAGSKLTRADTETPLAARSGGGAAQLGRTCHTATPLRSLRWRTSAPTRNGAVKSIGITQDGQYVAVVACELAITGGPGQSFEIQLIIQKCVVP